MLTSYAGWLKSLLTFHGANQRLTTGQLSHPLCILYSLTSSLLLVERAGKVLVKLNFRAFGNKWSLADKFVILVLVWFLTIDSAPYFERSLFNKSWNILRQNTNHLNKQADNAAS